MTIQNSPHSRQRKQTIFDPDLNLIRQINKEDIERILLLEKSMVGSFLRNPKYEKTLSIIKLQQIVHPTARIFFDALIKFYNTASNNSQDVIVFKEMIEGSSMEDIIDIVTSYTSSSALASIKTTMAYFMLDLKKEYAESNRESQHTTNTFQINLSAILYIYTKCIAKKNIDKLIETLHANDHLATTTSFKTVSDAIEKLSTIQQTNTCSPNRNSYEISVDKKYYDGGKATALEELDTMYSNFLKGGRPWNTQLSSGYKELDASIKLLPSTLTIIGARPSMGKTAFGINIGLNMIESAIEANKSNLVGDDKEYVNYVLMFSLEMSANQILSRLLSIKTKVQLSDMLYGTIKKSSDYSNVVEELKNLENKDSKSPLLNFFVNDTAVAIEQIERDSDAFVKQVNELEADKNRSVHIVIIIDYIQLIGLEKSFIQENRVTELTTVSRKLKNIACKNRASVIALSQLSRAVESRPGHKPQMSDLRDCGAIEQDADHVLLLFREEYYAENISSSGVTDIIIAKNRQGSVGTVKLYFESTIVKFTEGYGEEYHDVDRLQVQYDQASKKNGQAIPVRKKSTQNNIEYMPDWDDFSKRQ
ncbi:MAG: replicative DNA helicase [Paraclostridium sp.]